MDGAAAWDLYRSFLGAARFGSLSAAARDLGLTQPTLGRHIDALEAALGTKLFARSRYGLVPTPAALVLVPHAEAMEAAALALKRAVSGEAGEPAGAVRVTASNVIGVEVLPPILAQFRERHPAIAIELALSDRTQDLSRRDADIAVRMIRPTQKALIARRVGTIRIGLFAHARYLARRGTPRSIDDLAHHDIIGFDRDTTAMRALGMSFSITRDLFALRTDDSAAQINALRAGFGIGVCQVGIAARDKALVPVLPAIVFFKLETWLVMHQDLKSSRRVRLLFDHLAAALKAYAATG